MSTLALALSEVLGLEKEDRIEVLRARYEALRTRGQDVQFDERVSGAPAIPRDVAPDRVHLEEVVPVGWYWTRRVSAGTCLRINNELGTPGVACLIWNAADPTERLWSPDTVKVQWTARLERGRLLLSDMGRVLASIVEDTCGRHDPLLGAGVPRLDEESSPMQDRNGQENLVLIAGKLGLGPRDLHPVISFFAPVFCGADQRFQWDDGITIAGTHVDLFAEMDLLVGLSNCRHPLAPANVASASVRVMVWQPDRAEISRFCHDATDEAKRAYSHTREYLEQRRSRDASER